MLHLKCLTEFWLPLWNMILFGKGSFRAPLRKVIMLWKQPHRNSGRTYVLLHSVPDFLTIDKFIKISKHQTVKHNKTRYFGSAWCWGQPTFLIISATYTTFHELMLIICAFTKFYFKGVVPLLAIKVFKPTS